MNIEKIKPSTATLIIICSGVFFLVILSFFLLSRQMFLALDSWKLIGIGLGISLSIITLNLFFVSVLTEDSKGSYEEQAMMQLMLAAFFAVIIFSACLLFSYYVRLNIRNFYWLLFFVDMGVNLCLVTIQKIVKK